MVICSLSCNSALSVLLTLGVSLYGTILAPQLVMGPGCNAFEGIASSAYRDFTWEKEPKRSVKAAMLRVTVKARSMVCEAMVNGLIWLLETLYRVAKIAFRALKIPIRWATNSMNHWCSSENQSLTNPRSFPDLGVGTPAAKTTVEAPRCEISGGLKTEDKEVCRNDIELAKEQVAQEQAMIDKGIAKGSDASDLGATDCWAGIDISSMRSIGGSEEVEVDVALMMAEDDDNQISADGSVGGGAISPAPHSTTLRKRKTALDTMDDPLMFMCLHQKT